MKYHRTNVECTSRGKVKVYLSVPGRYDVVPGTTEEILAIGQSVQHQNANVQPLLTVCIRTVICKGIGVYIPMTCPERPYGSREISVTFVPEVGPARPTRSWTTFSRMYIYIYTAEVNAFGWPWQIHGPAQVGAVVTRLLNSQQVSDFV